MTCTSIEPGKRASRERKLRSFRFGAVKEIVHLHRFPEVHIAVYCEIDIGLLLLRTHRLEVSHVILI